MVASSIRTIFISLCILSARSMKILKIAVNKAYYYKDEEWVSLDKIGKNDLLQILNYIIENDFEIELGSTFEITSFSICPEN